MKSLHRLFISCKRKSSSYHGYISERRGNICVTYKPGLDKLFLKGLDTKYFIFSVEHTVVFHAVPLCHCNTTQHIMDGCIIYVPVELKKQVKGLTLSFCVIACQPLRIDHNESRAKTSRQEASAVI